MGVGTAVGAVVAVAGTAVGADVSVAAGTCVGAGIAVGAGVAAEPQAESVIAKTSISASKENVRRLFIYFLLVYEIGMELMMYAIAYKVMITRNMSFSKRRSLKKCEGLISIYFTKLLKSSPEALTIL